MCTYFQLGLVCWPFSLLSPLLLHFPLIFLPVNVRKHLRYSCLVCVCVSARQLLFLISVFYRQANVYTPQYTVVHVYAFLKMYYLPSYLRFYYRVGENETSKMSCLFFLFMYLFFYLERRRRRWMPVPHEQFCMYNCQCRRFSHP